MIGHTARERWVRWRVAAEVSAAVIRFPPASSLCSHAAPPDQRPDRTWDTWAAFMFPSESQGGRWWTKCRTFTRDQFNHPESICGSVKATGSSHSSRVTADFCCVFNLSTEALRDKWELFSCLFITSEQVKETFSYVFKISSFNMWNRTKGKDILLRGGNISLLLLLLLSVKQNSHHLLKILIKLCFSQLLSQIKNKLCRKNDRVKTFVRYFHL